MAQWLMALAALPGDLGSIPRNHTAAHNCLSLRFQRIRCSHTDIHASKNNNAHELKRKRIENNPGSGGPHLQIPALRKKRQADLFVQGQHDL